MEKPLLKADSLEEVDKEDAPAKERGCFCRLIIWLWNRVWYRESASQAETVQMLMEVISGMEFQIQQAEEKALGKREEAKKIMRENKAGHVEMARAVLLTAHTYDKQKARWFVMKENVERLKSDIVSQQQSLSVFSAFDKANTAMEKISKEMDHKTVIRAVHRLRKNMDNNQELAKLLGIPLSDGGDSSADELDRELDLLVSYSTTPTTEKGKEEEEQVPVHVSSPKTPDKVEKKIPVAL